MIPVLLLMTIGLILGYVLRNKTKFILFSNKATTLIIYMLLFLLGIGVGLNKTIISNIANIGFQAILITFGAILGSLILAYITYKLFFIQKNEK
ncbi:LysO family transporter [uncultured Lutibacter sp.]|uniref:LysO family transporter n=1 Tax=uncultured Lutibacter sp. TaxID=437739 RepID=UPI00261BE62B|nr:LysO family transporter [uncultured Lutibacter sp.]